MCESERFSTITEFLRFVQKESCDIDIAISIQLGKTTTATVMAVPAEGCQSSDLLQSHDAHYYCRRTLARVTGIFASHCGHARAGNRAR